MKKTRHSSSLKNKNSIAINILQDKLFNKLQKLELDNGAGSKYEDLDIKLLNNTPDALTDLIYRAKGITNQNQDKIIKAKKSLRVSKKEAAGTFLTGTGIYAVEEEQKIQKSIKQEDINFDPEQMLKQLTKKGQYDDLAELRRMIKKTDQKLGNYSKQVYDIKNDVMNAASQFKKYKLNRLKTPPIKKSHSVVRIKQIYHK